ncbi:membrane protein [Brachyspira hyodysenteriae]|uniref:Transmembrane protein n=1 Tax=Brachyspira hyodysenteriae (strain ATCC 49526 / WA1) TaxID=565034 RepID=A0A3B6VA71_BRAHW|nr:EamA family transporter [Brachyspira hyodysenteriae]ACN84229.1 transmembrane protein [Brachyspira hyodysenteriae WA1]KLI44907.1 membrane protein [Brachyspira hyodysenteriae]KLI48987.1 membrane protein [Brachyspira hyodysenteriae]
MDIIFALLSSIFASLTAILIKIGLAGINSNLATAIRTIIILIMSWVIVFYTNSVNSINTIETIKNLNTKTIIFIVLSGIATGLSWLFYFKALQIGNVNRVVVIDKLSIVFTIILAAIFLKEALNIKIIIGVLFIVAGTLIISFQS